VASAKVVAIAQRDLLVLASERALLDFIAQLVLQNLYAAHEITIVPQDLRSRRSVNQGHSVVLDHQALEQH
jgi:hypothetical protein